MVREYSGQGFFDRWDFYGSWDNLTLGDVWWLDRNSAFEQGLAYTDAQGRAVLRVDNTSTVLYNEKRNSVRITSHDSYGIGSLWITDITHLPYGCSVWPALWTKGPVWPDNGEIDIIEAINLMPANQYALHTLPGCSQTPGAWQTGQSGQMDCSQPSGCLVGETAANSFNEGFAQAGGGVWATQFDVAGILRVPLRSIWFWSRPNIPQSILQATSTSAIDITDFGTPSASYPAFSCNIPQFFSAQQLVIDITLCGQWAGLPQVYTPACGNSGPTGRCYDDNVVGLGTPKYDNAYFEISYIRAYTTGGPAPTPAASGAWSIPSGSTVVSAVATPTGSGAAASTSLPDSINTSPNEAIKGADWADVGVFMASLVGLVSLGLVWM
ncbi:hypothetical protein EW146_g6908 [Bondarzewia mesenterica]|uniref:GH16 domain-containing protein n=1 Tax=Bondarzewia mesenterica TaxID=1095465 RepID=A0A4S4LME7_9AGAM|nr:hypothetical protein EW146_g6908 [Bondarzewia mesenterica]